MTRYPGHFPDRDTDVVWTVVLLIGNNMTESICDVLWNGVRVLPKR